MIWAAAAHVAAGLYGVRAVEIMDCRGRKTRSGGQVRPARRVALYLACVAGNLSKRALARASGMDHSTIETHLARVEDEREIIGDIDARLDEMTERLGKVLPPRPAADDGRRAAA